MQALLNRVAPGFLHNLRTPMIADMTALGGELHHSVESALVALLNDRASEFTAEYQLVADDLTQRYAESNVARPAALGVEELTSALLYALVRNVRPAVVLETGVANGHSTVIILKALEANGFGELHSTDIDASAGTLLTNSERSAWRFHCLPAISSRRAFHSLLDTLPPISFFLHDSEHSYGWQRFELAQVTPRLAPGAIVSCDDVDSSYGFIDHCIATGLEPIFVLDRRKMFGIAIASDPNGGG